MIRCEYISLLDEELNNADLIVLGATQGFLVITRVTLNWMYLADWMERGYWPNKIESIYKRFV